METGVLKRDIFDRIGYTDVNFYPAYFVDNDYAKRIQLAEIKCCTLQNARFFHFWSRVFKQGSGVGANSCFWKLLTRQNLAGHQLPTVCNPQFENRAV